MRTSGGSQSLLLARLSKSHSDLETVLSLWRRMEVFLISPWQYEHCVPIKLVNEKNHRYIAPSRLNGLSLRRISELDLPRVSSIFELY